MSLRLGAITLWVVRMLHLELPFDAIKRMKTRIICSVFFFRMGGRWVGLGWGVMAIKHIPYTKLTIVTVNMVCSLINVFQYAMDHM